MHLCTGRFFSNGDPPEASQDAFVDLNAIKYVLFIGTAIGSASDIFFRQYCISLRVSKQSTYEYWLPDTFYLVQARNQKYSSITWRRFFSHAVRFLWTFAWIFYSANSFIPLHAGLFKQAGCIECSFHNWKISAFDYVEWCRDRAVLMWAAMLI